MEQDKPLQAVALMGATGTGKSALAMELASHSDTCLITCDSMQVYRGLDIGTAKPNLDEQKMVRHALIDCVELCEVWNAQAWANAARDVIRQENEQGRKPIIVGGTGMYLNALLQGFAEIPAIKEGVRAYFEAQYTEFGVVHLYEQLKLVDAPLAARLEQHDSQRILRGLCVFESTGTPLSTWHRQQDTVKKETQASITCPIFVLEVERETLRTRLASRFEIMMEAGWLDETKWLEQQDLKDTHPVMRAVGYRQLLNHIAGDCSLEQATIDGITATRRYAKRQNTWFRNQTKGATRGGAKLILRAIREDADLPLDTH